MAGANQSIDDFIVRWAASAGAERANFQLFAVELCTVIGVEAPKPSRGLEAETNDYCFERAVKFQESDGRTSDGRIDLYKRGAFVMEAKQSREKDRPKALVLAGQPDLFVADTQPRGQRGASRVWDQLMISTRRQAEDYAKALPPAHGWPPFVLVCDVGHCIEVYADFSGQGKNYAQFPDRQGFRVYLEELRDVVLFLMRCLFTMFAEDVRLLPEGCFSPRRCGCAFPGFWKRRRAAPRFPA